MANKNRAASSSFASSSSSSSSRTCLCSPSTHPGSFRCSLHKGRGPQTGKSSSSTITAVHHVNNQSTKMKMMKKLMMTYSKAHLLNAFLKLMIKPSSHHLQRRMNFKPRPTRFRTYSKHGDGIL
ncbi:PREDICTED: uncharacterized protein LOC103328152 [Prunus mume]|uniref:Uncharacterized protein LOC103328152 n=1 Tax=Prunus mume TaxID=102107 RepID=A0ABM0NRK7_PRUMU|nr:PREDICTED: uncharacterized protein LOC103328152 [Prunus mume]